LNVFLELRVFNDAASRAQLRHYSATQLGFLILIDHGIYRASEVREIRRLREHCLTGKRWRQYC
jgi:hypothetical protein